MTTSNDNTTRIWDEKTGQGIATIGKASPARTAEFQDNAGRTITFREINADRIYEASFSPDSQRLLTDWDNFTARIFDAKTSTLVELSGHTDAIQTLVLMQWNACRYGVPRWDRSYMGLETGQTTTLSLDNIGVKRLCLSRWP